MRIVKAWELARLILPSISSRAPYKTHLPALEHDHGNRDLVRSSTNSTGLVAGEGISGSLDFTSIRKTRRHSRDGLASHVIMCECAMEPIGPVWPRTSRNGRVLQLRCPLLASHTGRGLPCVRSDTRAAHLQGLADASCRGQNQPQQPWRPGKGVRCATANGGPPVLRWVRHARTVRTLVHYTCVYVL